VAPPGQVTITGDYNDRFSASEGRFHDVVVDLGSLSCSRNGHGQLLQSGTAVSISRLSTPISALSTEPTGTVPPRLRGVWLVPRPKETTHIVWDNTLWVSSRNASFTPLSYDDQALAGANIFGMATGISARCRPPTATSGDHGKYRQWVPITSRDHGRSGTCLPREQIGKHHRRHKHDECSSSTRCAHGIDLGTLTLSSSGLTFTAIPEPSTYALILGVFALGFVMLRRRAHASV